MLTDIKVRTAPPGRHRDGRGDGLCLLVRATGNRLWVQRLRIAGRDRELGHGSYPEVTLALARERAALAYEQARAGTDPLEARRAAREATQAAAARTLTEAVEGYLAAHAPGWKNPKTATVFRTSLAHHAARLMARPVATITLEDVRAVLSPIWTRTPVLAGKLRSRIERALEWATAAGWRHGPNPAAWAGGLRPLLARPSAVHTTRHHPALPWQQVPAFMAVLGTLPGMSARALAFVIATACRSGEARGATWDEIDMADAVWTVPARRMKTGRPHRVPLNDAAMAVLRDVLPRGGGQPGALVFPGRRAGIPLSDMSLLKVVLVMHAAAIDAGGVGWLDEHGARVTPHGFRTAFRSWCGDTGQPRELAEMALAHAIGSSVEQAYSRTDLLERRRVLMNAWSEVCLAVTAAAALP